MTSLVRKGWLLAIGFFSLVSISARAENSFPPCLYYTEALPYIASLYQSILHRSPTEAEYTSGLEILEANPLTTVNGIGTPAGQFTLDYNLAFAVLNSAEAKADSWNNNLMVYGAAFSIYGAAYTDPGHIVLFVIGLYQRVLNRAPDAAGLEFWSSELAAGLTRAQVAASFYSSPEYMTNDVLSCN